MLIVIKEQLLMKEGVRSSGAMMVVVLMRMWLLGDYVHSVKNRLTPAKNVE